jgi:transposase
MTALEPHPFSALFPPISDEDFGKLAADIKLNGLHQPIVRYQGKILDGNNRYRACELVRIAPKFADFNGDDAQARNYVISANIHRRHLSPDQRREIIATLLKADPTKSNRQIGETTKTSHHTVEAVRSDLETTGQIAQSKTTTGADGKTRKRKKKEKKSDKETITYYEVVDAITAYRAYQLFEHHLLDALEQLREFSPVDRDVGEYARGTIEKLEERLGEMQPAEEAA